MVVAPNQKPTAAFTASSTGLAVAVDASASHDPDGTIASYAWTFGDGATATGRTATHTYSTAGTYTIGLTVTDDRGGTDAITKQVTVAVANQSPTAAFTTSSNGLTLSANGTGSTDQDGSIASYAWTFGDGGSASGATVSHKYAGGGTYTVTLTVTDNAGATNALARTVTVTAPTVVRDTFTRTASSAWGTADTGGAWSVANGASSFSVNGTAGRMAMTAPSVTPLAVLKSVAARNVDATVSVALDKVATGSGVTVALIARRTTDGDYRLRVKFLPNGVLHLAWSRVVAGTETVVSEKVITPVYSAGSVVNVRFVLMSTDSATTSLSGTAWAAGTAQPAPQITATDTTSVLQVAGAFGLQSSTSSTTTNAPIVATFDDLTVTTAD